MADKINPAAEGGEGTTNADPKGETKTPATSQSFTEADVAARTEAAVKATLKRLGVEKIEDAEAAIKAQRERAEAEKSEVDRYKGKVEELGPKAKRAEVLEGTIKRYLEAEEKAIPKDKRELLELAPTDPDARLEWIQNAKAKGLFGAAAETPKTPANTRAGTTPPAAGAQQAKHPRDMTDAEFAAYQQQRRAQQGQR